MKDANMFIVGWKKGFLVKLAYDNRQGHHTVPCVEVELEEGECLSIEELISKLADGLSDLIEGTIEEHTKAAVEAAAPYNDEIAIDRIAKALARLREEEER